MAEDLEQSRKETVEAFKNRAILYRLFYEEISKEIGIQKSAEIMKKAIYKWGSMKSVRFKKFYEKRDFKGVAEEFVKTSPCAGNLFRPGVEKVDDHSAVLIMERCPLVEAWKDMGLAREEIRIMCSIANVQTMVNMRGWDLN